MFTNPEVMATAWGIPTFVPYIIGALFILFLVSWLLIFLGVKSRASAIIGSIMPILIAWAVIAGYFGIPPDFMPYVQPFLGPDWVSGIIPFSLGLMTTGSVTLNLGSFILFAGGIIGLISGFLSRE